MGASTGGDGLAQPDVIGHDHHVVALADPAAGLGVRIQAAAVRCVARRGVRRTTLDDVAREAGCSRATVYRAFPGGKDAVMGAAAEAEIRRLLEALGDEISRTDTLVDALVVAISGATRSLLGHDAFTYLLVNEPGVVRPYLAFDGLDPVLARAVAFLAPHLEPYLDPITASRTAEWVARLVVLYADPGAPFDLSDPSDARQLVAIHVLPGLTAVTPQEPVQ